MTPYSVTLNAINERHRILPTDPARGLVAAACAFYEEHGWFSFPVVVQPEVFQRAREGARDDMPAVLVAEEATPYGATPPAKKKPSKAVGYPRPALPVPPPAHESA